MPSMKEMLLQAPEDQIDEQVRPMIEKWDDEPTSLQILEVLDQCIHASLASGFVVSLLQNLYYATLKKENKTHEENVALATWRNNQA